MRSPTSPSWARRVVEVYGEKGRLWLAGLPNTVAQQSARWQLTVAEPFPEHGYHWVAPVRRADGDSAVLKLGIPGSPNLRAEAALLRHFGGRGAVRLLEADIPAGALLLERAEPGDPLATLVEAGHDDEATLAAAGIMEALTEAPSRPPEEPGFSTAATRIEELVGFRRRRAGSEPIPERLLDRAVARGDELLTDSHDPRLLHDDLHHGNVLRAGRAPWLAVDPRGIVAERAWEAGALLRNPVGLLSRMGEAQRRRILDRRIQLLGERLALDRGRITDWAFVQAVLAACWQVEDHAAGWDGWLAVARTLDELAF